MSTSETQALLLKVLEEIIPAGGARRMPSAGMKAVADGVLTATAYSNGSPGAVTRLLEAISMKSPDFPILSPDARVDVLKVIEADHPADFTELVRLTYTAYYSRPEIRPLLGVAAHPVHPDGYLVEPESDALMDELTRPVRARGTAYRQV
ncbi:hypothetical protein [uncultured Roseibium sp.]|uniref:hypothetical protein n=1 Tax=uncultured Roseibium sp. TaxID=1936171 RepID=UPI0026333459|nr:hypothetical protein [uncultured Roseibium sp.]